MISPALKVLRFITRRFPKPKGFRHLLPLYRKIVSEGSTFRIHDFDGDLKLEVNIRETIGISLWNYPDLYEKEERRVFCSAIRPGCAVLDVGANLGVYTLLAARRGARVFSVEADPMNAALLRRNITINGFSDRVTIFEMAATESPKTVPLYRNPANWGGSNLYQGVPAGTVDGNTIDSLNLPPIDVCKMDIEGSELKALAGMQHTLECSPSLKLLIECSREFGESEPLMAYLKNNFTRLEVIGAEARAANPMFWNVFATR